MYLESRLCTRFIGNEHLGPAVWDYRKLVLDTSVDTPNLKVLGNSFIDSIVFTKWNACLMILK